MVGCLFVQHAELVKLVRPLDRPPTPLAERLKEATPEPDEMPESSDHDNAGDDEDILPSERTEYSLVVNGAPMDSSEVHPFILDRDAHDGVVAAAAAACCL